jgi:hypothetical protein
MKVVQTGELKGQNPSATTTATSATVPAAAVPATAILFIIIVVIVGPAFLADCAS